MILQLALCMAISASPLDPMLSRLESAAFLEADFQQSDYWALTRETEVSSGHLSLAFPDRFLFEYESPDERELCFDGSTLFTVEHAARQVVISSQGGGCSFTGFLECGEDESLVTGSTVSGDTVLVTLEGDLGDGITSMEVAYTLSDSLPVMLSTVDANGNATSWTLCGASTSGTCPEGVFEMTVPPGYDTVRPSGY